MRRSGNIWQEVADQYPYQWQLTQTARPRRDWSRIAIERLTDLPEALESLR